MMGEIVNRVPACVVGVIRWRNKGFPKYAGHVLDDEDGCRQIGG